MRAHVRSDFWGQFTVQLSNPKESLDRCLVDQRKNSHQTLKELKECFFKKKPMFESSRRVEWQLLSSGLRLTEAEESCPKCGCFWRDHDPATCHGVGTREDNLWAMHKHYYPEILRILKEIVATHGAADNPPCPICDDEANHDWLKCVRMAQYEPLELLDCEIALRPPMGPGKVLRLRQEPLLWVEDDVDGKPIVKKSSSPVSLLQLYESSTFPFGVCPGLGRMGEKEVPMLQVPTTRS